MRQMRKLIAMRRKSSRSSRLRILPVAGSYKKFWPAAGCGAGTMHVPGRIDLQRQSLQRRREFGSQGGFKRGRVAEHARPLRFPGSEKDRPLAGHLPAQATSEQLVPPLAQLAQLGVVAFGPTRNLHQQPPLGEPPIPVEMFARVARKQMPLAIAEDFLGSRSIARTVRWK